MSFQLKIKAALLSLLILIPLHAVPAAADSSADMYGMTAPSESSAPAPTTSPEMAGSEIPSSYSTVPALPPGDAFMNDTTLQPTTPENAPAETPVAYDFDAERIRQERKMIEDKIQMLETDLHFKKREVTINEEYIADMETQLPEVEANLKESQEEESAAMKKYMEAMGAVEEAHRQGLGMEEIQRRQSAADNASYAYQDAVENTSAFRMIRDELLENIKSTKLEIEALQKVIKSLEEEIRKLRNILNPPPLV